MAKKKVVFSEGDIYELRDIILEPLEGKNARLCGAALSAAIAYVALSIDMSKEDTIKAAMIDIYQAFLNIEERQRFNGEET